MTEDKTILLQQIYYDFCSLFDKVNEDLNGNEDLYQECKNIMEKIHKNSSFLQIYYDLCSFFDKVFEEVKGNEYVHQELENIIEKMRKIFSQEELNMLFLKM